jgi:hypothetical protein
MPKMTDEALLIVRLSDEVSAVAKRMSEQYKSEMDKMKASSQGLGGALQWVKDNFLQFSLAIGASMALKQMISEAADAEVQLAKLGAALKVSGYNHAENKEEMVRFSEAMQQATGMADDQAVAMTSLFLTYGATLKEAQQLTKASADMAVVVGSVDTASMMLAKAMEGNTVALGRYGIKIDETELKLRGADAILAAVNEKFSGQAQAQLDTYTGQWTLLKENLNNFAEAAGGPITEALRGWMEVINRAVKSHQDLNVEMEKGTMLQLALQLADVQAQLERAKASGEGWGFTDPLEKRVTDLIAQMKRVRDAAKMDMGEVLGPDPREWTVFLDEEKKRQKERTKLAKEAAEERVKVEKDTLDRMRRMIEDSQSTAISANTATRDSHIELYRGIAKASGDALTKEEQDSERLAEDERQRLAYQKQLNTKYWADQEQARKDVLEKERKLLQDRLDLLKDFLKTSADWQKDYEDQVRAANQRGMDDYEKMEDDRKRLQADYEQAMNMEGIKKAEALQKWLTDRINFLNTHYSTLENMGGDQTLLQDSRRTYDPLAAMNQDRAVVEEQLAKLNVEANATAKSIEQALLPGGSVDEQLANLSMLTTQSVPEVKQVLDNMQTTSVAMLTKLTSQEGPQGGPAAIVKAIKDAAEADLKFWAEKGPQAMAKEWLKAATGREGLGLNVERMDYVLKALQNIATGVGEDPGRPPEMSRAGRRGRDRTGRRIRPRVAGHLEGYELLTLG